MSSWNIFLFRAVGQKCRWMGALGHGSQITVDLHTKCIKLADLSQTIWLIRSYSSTCEQGVVGRDHWHNRLCQTALQNAQIICGDNPDAIRAIIAPIHPRSKHSFSPEKGKNQLFGGWFGWTLPAVPRFFAALQKNSITSFFLPASASHFHNNIFHNVTQITVLVKQKV